MPAGRESGNADAIGVDVPLPGVGSRGANGALGVEQRHLAPAPGQAVFQDDAGDAVLVEPLGNAVALSAGDEAAIAAAGANDDGRAIGLVRSRTMQGDGCLGLLERAIADGGRGRPEQHLLGLGR